MTRQQATNLKQMVTDLSVSRGLEVEAKLLLGVSRVMLADNLLDLDKAKRARSEEYLALKKSLFSLIDSLVTEKA